MGESIYLSTFPCKKICTRILETVFLVHHAIIWCKFASLPYDIRHETVDVSNAICYNTVSQTSRLGSVNDASRDYYSDLA
jgi:hypothetical protein